MEQIKTKEDILLEDLVRNCNYFIIDEKGLVGAKGIVYERNVDFEAGFGNLYEIRGQLNPYIIAVHKKRMNPNYVKFIDENNIEKMLRTIDSCWVSWSEMLEGIEKYL